MLSYKRAETEFQKYIKDYDAYNDKIGTKIKHIFGVVHFAEQIAIDLNLSEEDIELAKIIALLHDIGRFEQITIYDSFIDSETVDHADLGVEMLKNESLIRKFACDERFDNIILKAIANHNKLRIEDGLNEREQLHSKIIRDADKMDNFIILPKTNMAYLSINVSEEIVGSQAISDEVFEGFMRCECLERSVLKNGIDKWIYHITWIF
ncbi:MAG: HD domain-containing protein, partial [Oscillospiraceae bacterium]|nr:HD domain-containing protein [Oscillospiraceae bacterium]